MVYEDGPAELKETMSFILSPGFRTQVNLLKSELLFSASAGRLDCKSMDPIIAAMKARERIAIAAENNEKSV
jgi:hypothetical protein